MFDGMKLYQQVPFQYSLHYLKQEDAGLKHHEYLAPAKTDPRKNLAEKFVNEIPQDSCVLVYNKQFEISVA